MCVSKFVRMSNQLSSIAIIFFFNNAAFREDNFESLTLFNFFLLITWVQDHVFDLILRNFKISKVLFSVQIPFNLSKWLWIKGEK